MYTVLYNPLAFREGRTQKGEALFQIRQDISLFLFLKIRRRAKFGRPQNMQISQAAEGWQIFCLTSNEWRRYCTHTQTTHTHTHHTHTRTHTHTHTNTHTPTHTHTPTNKQHQQTNILPLSCPQGIAPGVHASVGVTYGRTFCGVVGSDKRCEYTVRDSSNGDDNDSCFFFLWPYGIDFATWKTHTHTHTHTLSLSLSLSLPVSCFLSLSHTHTHHTHTHTHTHHKHTQTHTKTHK